MAKLIILGSGSGFSVSDRFCTSIACLVDQSCYLIDCGEPAGPLLFRHGIDPLAVEAVFISHLHPDHVGGLASLLFSMYLPGRTKEKKFKPWSITRYDDWYRQALWFPEQLIEETERKSVDLFLPEEGLDAFRGYLQAVYLPPEVLPYDLTLRPVRVKNFFQNDLISVSAVENDHLRVNNRYRAVQDKYPGMKFQSYSFLIEAAGRAVVFSGDIDHLEELNPLMDRADIAILEVAHYDPELIKAYVDRYPLDQVVLTHIHPGLEERMQDLLDEWQDPRIVMARDGFEIEL